ncbi:MAG: UDP-N-acetylglucosamine 1-carboxyvinyltransferase [Parcubacteria group bacterium GW2011_GWC2_45_7]|nr:MAG: UDP-N-acetylglucosamine 1-carboxyvinyltransferase [Parcubacteria group bacterium GW2011_GWC2_45_7]
MGYVHELIKMGANAIIADPHRVIIAGPTSLSGQEIKSLDLRAGATLVIAGLVAEGETILHDAEVIDRGYENLEVRLKAIGAEIKRVN